jgi:hypothetical protein
MPSAVAARTLPIAAAFACPSRISVAMQGRSFPKSHVGYPRPILL